MMQKPDPFGITSTTPAGQNDDDRASNFFSIMLPIILVIGVFVTVGVGLVIHRLLLRFLRKRWNSRSSSGNNATSGGIEGGYYSRTGLNTVSGNVSDLPTYRQVMFTIHTEETPPSYYEISGGVTNVGFTSDGNLQITIQPSNREEEQLESGSVIQEGVEDIPPPDFESEVNSSSSSDPNGSYCFRNELPPMKEVEKVKVKHDLEDVINSISVPSILPELEGENNNEANDSKDKNAKHKLSKQNNVSLLRKATNDYMRRRNPSVILTSTVL